MAVALSPWPPTTSAANRTKAVERLRQAVSGRTDDSDEAANSLGEAASAMVENYAPGAPQALKDEAVIRFAGYLAQAGFGEMASEQGGPAPLQFEYVTTHQNAWRNSGAAMLLTRWRVRRAGVIG